MNIVFLDGYTVNPEGEGWDILISGTDELIVYDRTLPEEVVDKAEDAEVLIVNKTPLTAEVFAQLPNLRLVCVAATGYDRIDVGAASRHGVKVSNCVGYSSQSVAQLVASFLLEVTDTVGEYAQANRVGRWQQSPDFCYTLHQRMELFGKKVAIVGFGHIGQAVAHILAAFGMDIWAVTHKRQEELPEGVRKVTMEEAFHEADVVSLHCPLTTDKAGFVNAALLRKANPHLILINTARGGLIHEADVAEALRENRLKAYCTDVLATEPPQDDCPLLHAPHCLVTPHIGWNTKEARRRILEQMAETIRRYKAGQPFHHVD